MFCPRCAAEVDDQARFCPNCGAQVATDQGDDEIAEDSTSREKFVEAARSRQGGGIEGEETVWEGDFSQWAMVGWWGFVGAITVALLIGALVAGATPAAWGIGAAVVVVAWLAVLGYYAFRRLSVHYQLTTQRFIHQRGLLWRRTDRIELIDIDDVTFAQGPVERMFGVGTIHISSSDKTHPEIDLPGIENVAQVAGQIDDLRRKERRQRGLHIEAV